MTVAVLDPDDDEWGDDDEVADLLPDDLAVAPKKAAVPLVRSAKQTKAAEKRAAEQAAAKEITDNAVMLAQIVNLHIAGHSLAAIGASIGATAEEVDRMLANESARYVRNQPALRTYVRNYVSGKYTALLDTVWEQATDKGHRQQLEYQDRALRIVDRMARLHGAEAPTQTEVKVDAAPEAVERLVQALATGAGMGYNTDIFDVEVIDPADVHDAVAQSAAALEVSGNAVEESDGHDEL